MRLDHLLLYLGLLCTWAIPASMSAMWAGSSWWHSGHHWTLTSGDTSLGMQAAGSSGPHKSARTCLFSIKFQPELSWKSLVPFFISYFLFFFFFPLSMMPFLPAFPGFNWFSSSAGSTFLHTFSSQLCRFHFSSHLLAFLSKHIREKNTILLWKDDPLYSQIFRRVFAMTLSNLSLFTDLFKTTDEPAGGRYRENESLSIW